MNEKIQALAGKSLEVNFYGETFHPIFFIETYTLNGRPCIELRLKEGDFWEPFCALTVNLPKEELNEGEVFIKDWSENERVAQAALASGLFRDTGKLVRTGFVHAPIWEVL